MTDNAVMAGKVAVRRLFHQQLHLQLNPDAVMVTGGAAVVMDVGAMAAVGAAGKMAAHRLAMP
jgi:hypothetical protein